MFSTNMQKSQAKYDLINIGIKSNPEVLLVYLRQEYFLTNTTSNYYPADVHCRPLLGLQYLVGALRSIGVESVIMDQRIISFDEKTLANYVEENQIILVGFYTASGLTHVNSLFISKFRSCTQVPIIVGGPGYTEGDELLKSGADFLCFQEGEETLKAVVKKIKQNHQNPDWSDVDGIAYVSNGKILRNRYRPPISNLDDIDFPVRDNLLPISSYRDYFQLCYREPYITMLTNRGCPHRCIYCDSPNLWMNKVRWRSPDNVLEEIDYAVKKWGIRYIDFLDDVFGIRYDWVREFCSKLAERKYGLTYKVLTNPSTFGDKQAKVYELLAKSGCKIMGIGVQSANRETLKFIERERDMPETLMAAVRNAKKNGIATFCSFITGFPNEPLNTVDETKDLIDEVRPTLIDAYPLLVLKDTKLYNLLENKDVTHTYTFEERVNRAVSIKRYFYSQPKNLLSIFIWVLKNNPMWLLYMAKKATFFLAFLAFSKKRVKEDLLIRTGESSKSITKKV